MNDAGDLGVGFCSGHAVIGIALTGLSWRMGRGLSSALHKGRH